MAALPKPPTIPVKTNGHRENELKYFPNYIMPYAEALIYPDRWDESAFTIADDQSSSEKLVTQDVLMREKK